MEKKENIGSKAEELLESMPELTFWDHLEVLRWALFRIACVLAVCTVVTFLSMPYIFDQYIMAPTTSDFFVYRWLTEVSGGLFSFADDFHVQIININERMMIMEYDLIGIGTVKMTVGIRRRTQEKVQYCITAITSK